MYRFIATHGFDCKQTFQDKYKQQFIRWYAMEIYRKVLAGEQENNIVVDFGIRTIKPLSFDWIVNAYNQVTPTIVQNGFQQAGILALFTSPL